MQRGGGGGGGGPGEEEEWTCPVCSVPFAQYRSASAREAHVNGCLDAAQEEAEEEEKEEEGASDGMGSLCFCVLCGKDMTAYNLTRREQHLNRCMEDAAAAEEEEESAAAAAGRRPAASGEGARAGSRLEFLAASPKCPCCKKPWAAARTSRTPPPPPGKLSHLKACARRKKLSVTQLLNLLSWLKYSAKSPERRRQPPSVAAAGGAAAVGASAGGSARRPAPRAVRRRIQAPANEVRTIILDDDEDFKEPNAVLFKRASSPANARRRRRNEAAGDTDDDEFRLATALSASLDAASSCGEPTVRAGRGNKKGGKCDASAILAIEEACERARENAMTLLFPDLDGACDKGVPATTPKFSRSKLFLRCEAASGMLTGTADRRRTSLWSLAAAKATPADGKGSETADYYTTEFLEELRSRRGARDPLPANAHWVDPPAAASSTDCAQSPTRLAGPLESGHQEIRLLEGRLLQELDSLIQKHQEKVREVLRRRDLVMTQVPSQDRGGVEETVKQDVDGFPPLATSPAPSRSLPDIERSPTPGLNSQYEDDAWYLPLDEAAGCWLMPDGDHDVETKAPSAVPSGGGMINQDARCDALDREARDIVEGDGAGFLGRGCRAASPDCSSDTTFDEDAWFEMLDLEADVEAVPHKLLKEEELGAPLRQYIVEDVELYNKILLYEPIEFTGLWQKLNAHAIGCSPAALRAWLERWGVTYKCDEFFGGWAARRKQTKHARKKAQPRKAGCAV